MQVSTGSVKRNEAFRKRRWDRMFVSRSAITSPAFLSLKTAAACQVYLIFLNKCAWKKMQGKRKRKDSFVLVNQNEIQFSYKEAENKWRIKPGRFTRAIDQLVEVGLIDIAKSGYGLKKDVTLYGISERWQQYGTPEFVHKKRSKRRQPLGFKKNNKLGQNSRSRKSKQL